MKLNKTVAALALTASSSSFAMIMPPVETKTLCLNVYEGADGVKYAGRCDESANNATLGRAILANGCAEDQISLVASKYNNQFDIQISSCLPPNVVQL